MKLKTIDIKAFRLFGEQHLDFTNELQGGEDSCANFVSIYAPNGFGKTSLFDAIEFGMTGNIHRLKLGNFDEQMKYEGKISDFSSFIHNKKMPDEKVSIRLGVEDFGNGIVEQVVEPNAEKSMLIGDGHNAFFTNTILSQDWFSEFLSATTADERFRSFMRNFHQSDDLLEYHSTLKSTQNSLGKERGKRQRELNQLIGKLSNEVDDQIVEKLEGAIGSLKENGINLKWQKKIDDDSLINLKLELDVAIGAIDTEKKQYIQMLGNLQQLSAGQGDLISPEIIEERRNGIATLKRKIAGLEDALTKVMRLKALLDQLGKLQKERKDCADEIARLTRLISGYEPYRTMLTAKTKYENEVKSCEGVAENQKKDKERDEAGLQDIEKKKEEVKREITVIDNKLAQLEADYAKYCQLVQDISSKEKKEQEIQANIAKRKDEWAETNKRKAYLYDIQKKVVGRQVDSVIEEYKQQSLSLIEIGQRIKQNEHAIKQEEQNIQRQTAYQGQVEELLVRARGMVNELKSGVCPLCGHNYGETEILLKNIEENKAISSAIETAMSRIGLLKEEIEKDKKKAEEIYQELTTLVGQAVSEIDKEVAKQKEATGTLTALLTEVQRVIAQNKKEITDSYKDFEGLQIDQIRQRYENNKVTATQKLNGLEQDEKTQKGKIEDTVKQLSQNEQKRSEAQAAIQAIATSEEFLSYQRLLKEGETADEDMLALWKTNKQDKDTALAGYEAQLKEIQDASDKLKEEKVDVVQETVLTGEISKLKADLNVKEEKMSKTIQFIRRDCKVADVNDETPIGEIQKSLADVKKHCEEGVLATEEKNRKLSGLMTLIEAAGKYNKQQLLKKEIEKADALLKAVEKGQNDVKAEIVRLQEYLTNYVKNFFQVELINELYNRIDPHPEYKEVKFECDFTLAHPRLNVYMGSRDKKNDQIVPNLYFSTAQVNILSFCIFLAKAMFAKTDDGQDVGCIFIDDPIQALDDINILSMIDLLRNVAFTMNRQIVITTHDQNFFGLLQKKIPQDKFNACYWEIYERGKFRRVEA